MMQTLSGISLQEVLNHTHDGVFVLDQDRRFLYFNAACERLTGYKTDEVVSTSNPCWQIIQCRDEQGRTLAGTLCPARVLEDKNVTFARHLMQIKTKGDQTRWVEMLYTPIRDGHHGKAKYVIGVMRDATENILRNQQWKKTIESLRSEINELRRQMQDQYGFASIVTRSPAIRLVLEKIRSACTNESPVLIAGEAGTGKEMVARTIHYNGLQKNGPFVPVTVAAFSADQIEAELFGYARGSRAGATRDYPGLYRAADGGTLLIKGVDRLPHSTQAALLRVLQDREVRPSGTSQPVPVHARVIATFDRPVQEAISSGAVRQELVHRLGVITIEIPSLRTRKEDIPLLVEQFITQLNKHSTRQVEQIAPEVWEQLESYDWPGNTRELKDVIESAFASGAGQVLLGDEVRAAVTARASATETPAAERPRAALDTLLADCERRAILNTLRAAGGGRSLAARMLKISRSRLYRRMDALGISPNTIHATGPTTEHPGT